MTDTTKPIDDSGELTEAELDQVAGAGENAGGNNLGSVGVTKAARAVQRP
jgi:hypothetical protein